jgi:DNA-binding XRE family transcriptional regulator
VDNNIKQIRKELKLTQRQLADAISTSQQQVQRIESGAQAPRFDMAVLICKALDKSISEVFPNLHVPQDELGTALLSKSVYSGSKITRDLEEAGFDMDRQVHFLKVIMKGGHTAIHKIGSHDFKRLWRILQEDERDGFAVYDTDTSRIALNLRHLKFSHFLFEPNYAGSNEEELSDEIEIMLADYGDTIRLNVDPDSKDLNDEDSDNSHWTEVQLQDLFFYADMTSKDLNHTVMIQDVDGETALINLNDASMISVPLRLAEPLLWKSEMEGYEEDEN